MSYVLSIVFHRLDRYPNSDEYGAKIDKRLAHLIGGGRPQPHGETEAPIKGFAGKVEYHESGPVFRLDPDSLPALAPVLTEIRAITQDWAERPTGHEPKEMTVSFCYGPVEPDNRRRPYGESCSWELVKLTRQAADAADSFDDLIHDVLQAGRS